MRKWWKPFCLLLAVAGGAVLLLIGVLTWHDFGYAGVVKVNWGLELPRGYREVYEADSGPSFTGDGWRYHVLEYRNSDVLEDAAPWGEPDGTVVRKAEAWLTELEVPVEEWGDFETGLLWYTRDLAGGDEMILLWERDTGRLYIMESFL